MHSASQRELKHVTTSKILMSIASLGLCLLVFLMALMTNKLSRIFLLFLEPTLQLVRLSSMFSYSSLYNS